MNSTARLAASALTFSLSAFSSRADTLSWIGTTGNWDVPANWSGNTLPTTSDTAYIDNTGAATLPVGVLGTYKDLFVGTASGSSSTISITGGNLSGGATILGESKGSFASTIITSGTWKNTSYLIVGYSGTGSMLVSGGLVSNAGASIGEHRIGEVLPSGSGSVVVSGGTWSSSYLIVGNSRPGSLAINGGLVSSQSSSTIGRNDSGSAVVNSGTWTTSGLLMVGMYATGSLLVEGGSVFNTDGYLGHQSVGRGDITVTGQGSTWINSGSLTVGREGSSNNILTIQEDALVKVGDASGETMVFSVNGGSGNVLRLDDGYIALFGDQTAYVGDLITDGYIQLWDGSQWVTAEAGDIHFVYFTNDASGEAAAESATGYSGLGGYTVASTQAVPEPTRGLLAALGAGALLLRRRRSGYFVTSTP